MVVSGLEVGYSLKVSFLPEKKKKKNLKTQFSSFD